MVVVSLLICSDDAFIWAAGANVVDGNSFVLLSLGTVGFEVGLADFNLL